MTEDHRSTREQVLLVTFGLVAVVVITIVRISLVGSLHDQGYFGKYLILADRWIDGDAPVERFSDVSLAYLWLVTILRRVLDPIGIRTFQVVLTSVAAVLCGVAAWRIAGRSAAIAATVLVLASRAVLINATEIEPETMILVAVSGFFTLFPFRTTTLWRPAGAGVFAGLAIALRPTFALPFVLVLAWLASRTLTKDREVSRGVIVALMIGALIPASLVFLAGRAGADPGVSMNPGTVFYEGMNPYATGYAGVQPRIVNDLENVIGEPDSLHIAYRIVAARALGHREIAPSEANRFWSAKAYRYALDYPLNAVRLTLAKLFFSVHAHDSWDLVTMVRKDRELESLPWISFGTMIPLVLIGLANLPRRDSAPLLLVLLGQIGVMAIFYVTARQRNVVWSVVAILGGCALAEIAKWLDRRRLIHAFIAILVLLTGSLLLSHPWQPQLEDRYSWTALLASTDYWRASLQARQAGDEAMEQRFLVFDRLWLDDQDELLDPPDSIVCSAAIRRLEQPESDQRSWDLAMALVDSGCNEPAYRVLSVLSDHGYAPRRGNLVPQSVSWQRARIALVEGRFEDASELLERAAVESPGAPEVVAALGLVGGKEIPELRRSVSRHVDPFSADLAILRVMELLSRDEDAAWMLGEIERSVPEWDRPRRLFPELRKGS